MDEASLDTAETLERKADGVVWSPDCLWWLAILHRTVQDLGTGWSETSHSKYCWFEVAVSPLDNAELYCASISVLAVYTGVVVNVFPATTPTTAQNSTISTIQCFLMALNTSDIVMFPLILTLKRALHPTCRETLSLS